MEDVKDDSILGLAKQLNERTALPAFIPKEIKNDIDLSVAPQGFKGASMVIKAGLKGYKKKTPVRFFRISNKAWGIIVGEF